MQPVKAFPHIDCLALSNKPESSLLTSRPIVKTPYLLFLPVLLALDLVDLVDDFVDKVLSAADLDLADLVVDLPPLAFAVLSCLTGSSAFTLVGFTVVVLPEGLFFSNALELDFLSADLVVVALVDLSADLDFAFLGADFFSVVLVLAVLPTFALVALALLDLAVLLVTFLSSLAMVVSFK